METGQTITFAAFANQFLVGLSRAMILFIVSSGMSFVLGVLRVPNVAHGSLYMIGAFSAFSISTFLGGGTIGFWVALILSPFVVALVSLIAERALFCHLYEREHLMLLLFTFALMLILGDLVKLIWGAEYRSFMATSTFRGSIPVLGSSFPKYNLFLLVVGPLVAIGLWLFTNKTKIGKIARAAAVDREMVGAMGHKRKLGICLCICLRLFPCRVGWRVGGPNHKHCHRDGSRHHYGGISDRHYRWIG